MFEVSNLDFLHRELAVTVGVESLEDLGEVVTLLLAHELGSDEGIGGLLEGHIAVEAGKVVEGAHGEVLIDLEGSQLGDPRVLEGLLGGRSLLRVVGQKGANEALSVLGDGLPDAVIEGELAFADFLHNFLVGLSVEGRHT